MADLPTPSPRLLAHCRRMAQRGVSLIFALMTLVALSLASVAMIRSIDSGTLILGNLGFKQDTQLAADDAARTAIAWLSANVATTLIQSNSSANGYYASVDTNLNPTGNGAGTLLIGWDTTSCTTSATLLCPGPTLNLANGVTARYLIVRLCSGTGPPPPDTTTTITCAKPLTASTVDSGKKGGLDYVNTSHTTTTATTQYFRILVRARGPRNTTTFTETVVHF